ncbi:MAG: HEAT repeat domain-containing protein [Phycisphaerae bacterium]
MVFKYVILLLALLSLTGCGFFSLGRPALASDDPALKIPAMKIAARHHDQSAIPLLIKALSSQDSAIRFYAIYALRKITGHEFGYIYYASEHRRKIAIRRWKKWLATQQPARTHAAVFNRRVGEPAGKCDRALPLCRAAIPSAVAIPLMRARCLHDSGPRHRFVSLESQRSAA